MPRQAQLYALDVFQHMMACGIEKTRIFCNEVDYRLFVKRLGDLLDETHVDCFAWVSITNHFHKRE